MDVKRALVDVDAALGRAWLADDPLRAMSLAVAKAVPEDVTCIYPGAVGTPPAWMVTSFLPGHVGFLPMRAKLPRIRAYRADSTDPFADRPVDLRTLAGHVGNGAVEAIRDEALAPLGFGHQLRSVLYDVNRRVELFIGLYRRPGARPHDLADHARLMCLQERVRCWARVAGAIGLAPLDDDGLVAKLARVDAPALLVSGREVIHANATGRALAARDAEAFTALVHTGARVPVRARRGALDLVLATARPPARDADILPPYLRPVARLLAEGLCDKEIAAHLDTSLSTARTYTQRVLHALGAHSRRDLMRRR